MFRGTGRLLRRLLPNTRGNTFAIVAAALIPITAMIGSGIDISRGYMARNRMQNACDAGALAARRVLQNDTLTQTVIDTGKQFFRFNYPANAYQTEAFEPVVTKPETGVIRITASSRIPTMIMRLFGIETLPVNVDCDASLNFVNTDVVLVLDVTGSMSDTVPAGDGTNVQKIIALREAVMALYDELAPMQAQLEAQGLRLRYGIVPYSSSVNVGRLLYSQNSTYIRDSSTYQSRVANYAAAAAPTTSSDWEIYGGSISTSACSTWVTAASVNGGGPAPTATTVSSYRGSSSNASYVESTNWGWSGASDTSGTSRSCRRWRTVVTTYYPAFTNWTYQQSAIDTSTFKTPTGTITIASVAPTNVLTAGQYDLKALAATNGPGITSTSYTWNGCIENRDTVSTITSSSGYSVPTGAHDLNVNLIPSSDATRWRPMLPQAVYTRTAGSTSTSNTDRTSTSGWMMNNSASSGYYACPAEARRLQTWTRANLNTYVNGLSPIGGTYHDVGMIWGGRFISTGGVFADGCETYNSMPCNRHVIFMTDGQQTAYCNVYSAYGVERNDMRVKGATNCTSDSQSDTNTADLVSRHVQRFKIACNQTKNLSASVWVVAFDTTLNSNLIDCASNSDQAKTSTNKAQLIAQFKQIANQIGALRLVE